MRPRPRLARSHSAHDVGATIPDHLARKAGLFGYHISRTDLMRVFDSKGTISPSSDDDDGDTGGPSFRRSGAFRREFHAEPAEEDAVTGAHTDTYPPATGTTADAPASSRKRAATIAGVVSVSTPTKEAEVDGVRYIAIAVPQQPNTAQAIGALSNDGVAGINGPVMESTYASSVSTSWSLLARQ